MNQPFVVRRRVEFAETDMAGMMHFSNFLRFMEQAEQDYVRSRGLSPLWESADGSYGFPRVSAQCDYLKPVKFAEILDIEVRLEQVGSKSITYGFEFRSGDQLVAKGKMSSVCCRVLPGGKVESIAIPQEYREKIGTPAAPT
jgi:YbgC/YbaW family acyl-CoA thioester hydrolase